MHMTLEMVRLGVHMTLEMVRLGVHMNLEMVYSHRCTSGYYSTTLVSFVCTTGMLLRGTVLP